MTDKCQHGKDTPSACTKDARAALKTTRGVRFTTVVYWNDREAPKIATRLCKEHAVAMLLGLGTTLIDLDD